MTIPANSKSYPFLAIAQAVGADYGDVLNYASYRKRGLDIPPTFWEERAFRQLGLTAKLAVEDALRNL